MKIKKPLLLPLVVIAGVLCRFWVPTVVAPVQAAPAGPTKRALLIAVGDYQKPYKTRTNLTDWHNLNTALDVENMKSVLTLKWGFQESNVWILQDLESVRGGKPYLGKGALSEGATRAGILATLQELVKVSQPGDVVVIMFSGHGQQVYDQPAGDNRRDESDGLDETLVPYDYITGSAKDGYHTNVRDDDLNAALRGLSAKVNVKDNNGNVLKQGSITVLMDSCHSGTVTRGMRITRGRSWDVRKDGPLPKGMTAESRGLTAESRGLSEDQASPLGSGFMNGVEAKDVDHVLISACQDNQSAYEAEGDDNTALGGALTFNFCRTLAQLGGKSVPTYREVFQRVTNHLRADQYNQTPTIEGEADRLIFGSLVQPAAAYPVVQDYSAGLVTLDVGQLQGVENGDRYSLFRADTDPQNPNVKPMATVTVSQVASKSCKAPLSVADLPEEIQKSPVVSGDKAVLVGKFFSALPWRVIIDPLVDALLDEQYSTSQFVGAKRMAAKGSFKDEKFDFAITSEPASETGTKENGAKPRMLTLRRSDDPMFQPAGSKGLGKTQSGVVAIVPDDAAGRARLEKILLGLWRWRYINKLTNDSGRSGFDVHIRVVPVAVELNERKQIKAVRGDLPMVRTAGGTMVLKKGEYFQLEIENRGRDAYATVLDLQPNGSIAPIFPNPHPAMSQLDNHFKSGTKVRLPGTYTVQEPYGTDIFKVIATPDKVDFRSVLFQMEELPPGSRGTTVERGTRAIQSASGRANPLARLLLNASSGQRGGVAADHAVDPEYWGTSSISVETREK